jgi:hypothetical protein
MFLDEITILPMVSFTFTGYTGDSGDTVLVSRTWWEESLQATGRAQHKILQFLWGKKPNHYLWRFFMGYYGKYVCVYIYIDIDIININIYIYILS